MGKLKMLYTRGIYLLLNNREKIHPSLDTKPTSFDLDFSASKTVRSKLILFR
jgi:hypothetical protein